MKKREPKKKVKPILATKDKEEIGLKIKVLDTDKKEVKASMSRLQQLSRLSGSPRAIDK